jgi:hypothetical protein
MQIFINAIKTHFIFQRSSRSSSIVGGVISKGNDEFCVGVGCGLMKCRDRRGTTFWEDVRVA